MADDEDIAALVIDNGSGMCKGVLRICSLEIDALRASLLDGDVAAWSAPLFSRMAIFHKIVKIKAT